MAGTNLHERFVTIHRRLLDEIFWPYEYMGVQMPQDVIDKEKHLWAEKRRLFRQLDVWQILPTEGCTCPYCWHAWEKINTQVSNEQ